MVGLAEIGAVSDSERESNSMVKLGAHGASGGDAGIPNFHKVTDWLYRGGQPTAEGYRHLRTLGVKTVICLRWSVRMIKEGEKLALEEGMNFESLPLNYWTFPSAGEIERFLAWLDNEDLRPIYVHCKHGSDRTGLLLAIYRMARHGWDADSAYEEMRERGFHKIKMHHFKWAVYGFARRHNHMRS